MLIKYMSDLHLDANHSEFVDKLNPEHKDTILVLAGDICEVKDKNILSKFLHDICPNYRHVLYVLGNHEYYRSSINRAKLKLRDYTDDIPNFIILDRNSIIIDDVKFIGATLWTDMDNNNPMFMLQAGEGLNDFRKIRWGTVAQPYQRKFRPMDSYALYLKDLEYIKSQLTYDTRKTVVITHHVPCISLMRETKYAGYKLNPAYASRLEGFVANSNIDLWICGHVHEGCDRDFYGTRIVRNSRGYSEADCNTFNPNAIIEI